MIKALALVALVGLAAGHAWHSYMHREVRVPGSPFLAALRALALALALVLLFDLRLGTGTDPGERIVLIDESESMFAVGGGTSAWEIANARAAELSSRGWRTVAFGGETDTGADGTALAPALRRAAELGAGEIVVLSDMRFRDLVAAEAERETLPVRTEFEITTVPLVNVGIVRFEVSDAPVPGDTVTAEVEVFGEGSDSALVEITGGRVPVRRRVALPEAGRSSRFSVEIEASQTPGVVRYAARAEALAETAVQNGASTRDDFDGDDEASAVAAVGHRVRALVLVSALPDWEPRHLLPSLARFTGLPAVGYLRTASGWAPMGTAAERSAPVASATVAGAVADAALLVAHRIEADAELEAAVASSSAPLIRFPSSPSYQDPNGAIRLGGEWYVVPGPPPSPIAAGLDLGMPGLPPLADLLADDPPAGALPVLEVARSASTEREPALYLLSEEGRRVAIVAATGFWRWAMRDDAREVYRRLWSSVAGWLLAGPERAAPEPSGPAATPSRELAAAAAALEGSDNRVVGAGGDVVPLRTLPWPYLAIVALLSAEWYGRRRSGLR